MSANMDTVKLEAEIAKLNAETVKLQAETIKLQAEGRKFSREVFWYPVAISTALIGAVAGVTLALNRLIG